MKKIAIYLLFVLLITGFTETVSAQADQVNPMIGTGGDGNTFPGAVLPWGLVSVSPHNSTSPSGYKYGGEKITGFGHVHLSGVGCPAQGSVILLPQTGSLITSPSERGSTYSGEKATAGYYSVHLDQTGITAELTATLRTGLSRYRFPAVKGNFHLVVDAGTSLSERRGGEVKVVSPTEIEGYNLTGGFCGSPVQHKVFFVIQTSKKSIASGTWLGNSVSDEKSVSSADSALGAWFSFRGKAGDTLLVKVGVSYVSIANARENLKAEQKGFNFSKIRKQAVSEWNKVLSRISVKGGRPDEKVQFYTALYHSLIHPGIKSDVTGEYVKMGGAGTGKSKEPQYTVFSLWDTYRTVHPLLNLVYPEKNQEIVRSMLTMAEESDRLPKWELASGETRVMVGDPATIVITEAWLKGNRKFDTEKAWRYLWASATDTLQKKPIRNGLKSYIRNGGWIALDDTTDWIWGPVSTSLEYNLADWHLAEFARGLEKKQEAELLFKRSEGWRRYFDSETGFLRPVKQDGTFLTPFNPDTLETTGQWPGSGGPGYVEGNAWQYTFFVPHDLTGLVTAFGGNKPFFKQLNFAIRKNHINLSNEPSFGIPFALNILPGENYRSQELVRQILPDHFKNSPAGLPGNDDAGSLSAWYVFSSIGLFPFNPGSGVYQFTSPLWDEVKIKQGSRRPSITIRIHDNSADRTTIGKRLLNGKKINEFSIDHSTLTKGATLEFFMYDRIVHRIIE